jgi:hypothetical protein
MRKIDPDQGLVAGLIARLEDAPPPEQLCAAIMDRIQPKRPGPWQSLRRRLQTPLAVLALRPLTAAVIPILLVGLLLIAKTFWMPYVTQMPAPYPDGALNTRVTFMLDWPSAQKVAVIGSFNHWHPAGFEMHRNPSSGLWQLSVPLAKGRYAYAFIIDDGQIIADPRALWMEEDGFGGRDALMIVDNGNDHGEGI